MSEEPSRSRRRSIPWQTLGGYLLATGGLLWVLHDVQPAELARSLGAVNWMWVVPAIFCDILGYVAQGWRWQLLLRPVGRLPVLRTTQAIYAGLFVNEVAPMRLGEVARAWLVSRWLGHPLLETVPSMAVERLQDALWLAIAFGVTALAVPLPETLTRAGNILGIATLVAVAIFAGFLLRNRRESEDAAPRHGAGLGCRLRRAFARLRRGLLRIGFSRELYLSFGVSFFLLLFQALAFWLIMPACGLKIPFWTGMVVFLIVHIGTAIPNAPANVGSYQFFTVLGLTLFGADKTQATAFSLVAFILLTIPLWLLGFWALSRSGSSLGELRRDLRTVALAESPIPRE